MDMTHGIEQSGNKTRLYLENIKCGGCASTITKALEGLKVTGISVDPETSSVEINNPADKNHLNVILAKLREIGYPLIDTEEGIKALALKAKSYMSCAIGKLS